MDGAAAQKPPPEAADPEPGPAGSGLTPGGGSPSGPGSSAQQPSAAGDVPDAGRVPRPGAYFTGRQEELRQLGAALREGERAALLPQALYGLGGVGKTQLALEYVRRHAGDYDMVWWVQAEQPVVIRGSLTALASRLDIRDTETPGVVGRVIAALEAGRPVKRWLLVFDNAGAPEEVERFLPYMTGVPGGIGHVIVTSRDSGWSDSVPSLHVGVFPRDESVDFLRRRAPGTTAGEAGRLALALGDLPLALEQAAAMKVKSGLSADDYLDLLETQGPRVRGENSSTASGTQSVAAVWQVSMRDLQSRSPGALELLRLLAFFGPDPVQQSFLHDARLLGFPEPLASLLQDRIARSRAIGETGRYSLLTTDVGTVQLHRLLRSVLQDELEPEEAAEMRSRVHQVLVAHDPGDPQVSGNWEKYQDLLPHIRPSGMLESDDQEARWTVLNVARYLFARGDYQSSVELCREIVRTWSSRLGEDHLQTLGANRRLAAALWAQGSYEEARELNRTTLDRLRRTVGDDHEESLALAGLVAADLRAVGSFREALEFDRDVFEHSVRLYGRDDSASSYAGHNYAVSLRMNGLFSDAYDVDHRNGEVYLRSFGPSSLLTLLAVNNVARDLRELGQYADSVRLQEKTVAQYQQFYGETHPHTLRAVKNLSVSYRKAGDRDKALVLARNVLANYREVLGENHMDTLAALTNLANDLRLNGDAQGARETGADALRRYRSVLGPAHPFTCIAAVNQAAALRASGEFPEARRMDEETVAGMARSLWEEHVWLQIARINLATGVAAAGDPATAAVIGAQAAEQLENQYGDSHPHTLTALRNLALDLERTGDLDGSEELLAKVRRRSRATLGERHPETVSAQAGLRAEGDLEPPPI
jgi:tetratricopeptide (TPR) repeat protein